MLMKLTPSWSNNMRAVQRDLNDNPFLAIFLQSVSRIFQLNFLAIFLKSVSRIFQLNF
jgi:hypothetical protein